VAVALIVSASVVRAQEEPTSFSVRSSFKSSVLFSQMPDDPTLFPDRHGAEGFWRVRFEPVARLSDLVSAEAAIEQRVWAFSSQSGLSGVLPPAAAAPFRIRQLDWRAASGDHGVWRIELDRAAVQVKTDAMAISIGRQAIGWGRGVLFGAIDLFAPFTPLEADREWRRGVDAVRAEVKLADRVSLEGVAAAGEDVDHSAFASRVRGYAGNTDLEVVAGRRARDTFTGAASSAAVGPAELHGEVAVFDTPTRIVTKVVAGGSYRIPAGTGVLVYLEYHYSGFGAASVSQIAPLLADPAFQERYLRGDMQILGRHAAAALASYEFSPEWSAALEWLQSPTDGSGVLVPSATMTLGDRVSVLVSGYIPFGRPPTGLAFASDFGASPRAVFAQFRFYR
jgi:hypothetical protein